MMSVKVGIVLTLGTLLVTLASVYYLMWRMGSLTAAAAVLGAAASWSLAVAGAWIGLRRLSRVKPQALSYREKQPVVVLLGLWGLVHAWIYLAGLVSGLER